MISVKSRAHRTLSLVADLDPFQAGSSYGSAHPDVYTQQFWQSGWGWTGWLANQYQ